MKSIVAKFSIDFYNECEAGVNFSINSNFREEEQWKSDMIELFAFSCHLIRHFSNMGKHPLSDELTRLMEAWISVNPKNGDFPYEVSPHDSLFDIANRLGIPQPELQRKYSKPLLLVQHHGKGEKTFAGKVTINQNGLTTYLLKIKGFGVGTLAGVGIPRYSTNAVMILLAYLASKSWQKGEFIAILNEVIQKCDRAYITKSITRFNQELIATEAVVSSFPDDIQKLWKLNK